MYESFESFPCFEELFYHLGNFVTCSIFWTERLYLHTFINSYFPKNSHTKECLKYYIIKNPSYSLLFHFTQKIKYVSAQNVKLKQELQPT